MGRSPLRRTNIAKWYLQRHTLETNQGGIPSGCQNEGTRP